jgi:hypothetical protein
MEVISPGIPLALSGSAQPAGGLAAFPIASIRRFTIAPPKRCRVERALMLDYGSIPLSKTRIWYFGTV